MAAMLIGDQRPRFEYIPPALSNSKAQDAIELAAVAGLDLDPWQRHVLNGSLGTSADGKWSAFEVGLVVSRQNGKGSILEARELAGLYLFKTDRLMIHTAHEQKTANEHFLRVWSLIDNTPELRKQVLVPNGRHSEAYGRQFIELRGKPTIVFGSGSKWVQRNGSKRLNFIARTGSSGRGFTADLVVYDEDMILDAGKVGASLPSLLARPNAQAWFTGSAGLKGSTQEARIRRRGLAAATGDVDAMGRMAFFEWSINWHTDYCPVNCTEHDDPYTQEALAKANPGYNIRIAPESYDELRLTMTEEEYLRECLGVGQYPAPLDGWLVIPKKWYEDRIDDSKNPARFDQPVFAIDASNDRSSATIAVSGKRFEDDLTGIQVVDEHEGTGWVIRRAKQLNDQYRPVCWVIQNGSAAGSFIADLEKAGLSVEKPQSTEVAHACAQLYDAFRDDTLRHFDQESIRKAVAAVDKHTVSRDTWVFDRQNSGVDIAPLMAVTLAHWGYLRFGVDEEYDARDTVHFDLTEIKRLYKAGAVGRDKLQMYYEAGIITDAEREELADAGIYF